MIIRNIYIALLFVVVVFPNLAVAQTVSGKILGEKGEPVPFATIFVAETREGTISNADGKYSIQLEKGTYVFTIRSMGYIQEIREVNVKTDSVKLDIRLKLHTYELSEVKVFPGKEDPAWFIMRKAIAKAPYYRQKIKHYEADMYIKANFFFSSIPGVYKNKIEIDGRKLKEVIKENVTYVIESQNKITFTYPNKYEQKVISKKTSLAGLDEPPVMEMMSSSFYDERPNNLISPLSAMALKHYNFRYEGYFTVGSRDVFKIKVIPNRKSDELVDGYIYIIDQLWCIYNLDFKGRFEFFEYRIKQQFENLGNNNWLPVSDNIDGSVAMLGLKGQFYYGVALKYNVVEDSGASEIQQGETKPVVAKTRKPGEKEQKLKAEAAAILAKEELSNRDVNKASRLNRQALKEQYKDTVLNDVFRTNYKVEETKDTLSNDLAYWDTIRAIPLTPAEMASYAITDSLMGMKLTASDSTSKVKTQKNKKLAGKIIAGHWDLAKDSVIKLGYDGLFSIKNFDFNTVDGYKYRQHFDISFKLDSGKRLNIVPEIGYAFNRKALFGSLVTSTRNILWKGGSVALGMGKEATDFKTAPPGIQPNLNAVSSFFFAENYMRLYENTFFKLSVSHQLNQKISFSAIAEYNNFGQLENNISYYFSDSKEYDPNIPYGFAEESPELAGQKSFSYQLGFSYYKRQRKPWMEASGFIFLKDYYNISLSWRQGVKNVFSSVSDFGSINFNYRQQANISPTAGIDLHAGAGYFVNNRQMHFSQFKHFKTNEIPVMLNFYTHSFQLVNDYKLSTNKSYLNLGGEYRSEYLLMRYLSFINTRTWSESFHLNYIATPAVHSYWEAGYSLNSLFFVGNLGVFTGFTGGKFEGVMVKLSISGY